MLLAPFELYVALVFKVFLLSIKEHQKNPKTNLGMCLTLQMQESKPPNLLLCSRQMCTLLLVFTVTFAFLRWRFVANTKCSAWPYLMRI